MSGCEGYNAISGVYDRLNAEIDYEAWADFIERCFDCYLKNRPDLVLDLACGTGSMTLTLAKRGYDMIGVDGSADMLSVAYSRAALAQQKILYLLQDMRSFELYGTVGAVTCCLDSVNYLLSEEDVRACFSCVHNYLDPDGIFLFDVNTPYKFEHIYDDLAYVLEDDVPDEQGEEGIGTCDSTHAIYCGWQNHFDRETGICDFDLSLFEENEDGSYTRSDEHQQERCYPLATLERLLMDCGFTLLGVWSDYSFSAPEAKTQRWYIAARCNKNQA